MNVTNVTTIVPPFPYPFPDGYAATAFANVITSRESSGSKPNTTSVSKSFSISIEYCTPKIPGPKSSTLQLLTHGLGFDKTYWDFKLPNSTNTTQYSYLDSALSSGYSTLSWDRLGCGASTAANPYTEIQATVELALLTELTTLARLGKLSAHIPKPQRVIHVGHSWGSELTNALVSSSPSLSDAVVLTGYSHVFPQYQLYFIASTNFHLASQNQPQRFHNYSSGYLTWSDKYSNQYSFFNYPYFDPAILDYAERTKWPCTVGEFISQSVLNYNATSFQGPVLYLAAEHDLIYCQDDCSDLLGPKSPAVATFNASKSVEVYIQPNTGHAINLHKNATAAFGVAMDWATRQGF